MCCYSQLPSSILDITEWEAILRAANEYHQSFTLQSNVIDDIKHDLDLRVWLATQAARECSQDVKEIQFDVNNRLLAMENIFKEFGKKLLIYIASYAQRIENEMKAKLAEATGNHSSNGSNGSSESTHKLNKRNSEPPKTLHGHSVTTVAHSQGQGQGQGPVSLVIPSNEAIPPPPHEDFLKTLETCHLHTLETYSDLSYLHKYKSLIASRYSTSTDLTHDSFAMSRGSSPGRVSRSPVSNSVTRSAFSGALDNPKEDIEIRCKIVDEASDNHAHNLIKVKNGYIAQLEDKINDMNTELHKLLDDNKNLQFGVIVNFQGHLPSRYL